MNSTVSCIKNLILAYKDKRMSEDVNQAIFNLITSVMGEDSADVFSKGMTYHEPKNSQMYAVFNTEPEFLWKTIVSNIK